MRTPRAAAALALLCAVAVPGIAQRVTPVPIQPQVDPARPDWENPAVFARGKLPARASGFPFESRDLAMRRNPAGSARFLSLDGQWRFHFSPGADRLPVGFEQPDYDVSGWKSIVVPADWQAKGYDQPRYNNITYPFPINRPLIPHATNPVGSYRRDIDLPRRWLGQDVILHIGAAGSAYYVWVNGVKVGYSEDSKLPSEFDVTRHLRPGRNIVAIQVLRWSDGSYLEDQDFWRVSGIERSVWLMAAPRARIADQQVVAGLANGGHDGTVDLTMKLTRAAQGLAVRATVIDKGVTRLTRTARVSGSTLILRSKVPGIRSWSAETPELYDLLVELIDRRGAVVQATNHRIGFRTVAIRGGVVAVNGRPITIRGVNRHEHDPETFHVISEASMRRDLELMKLANVNAIRTSHYPNDERLYDLADEYGFYLMDEANVESHGYLKSSRPDAERPTYELGYDAAWRDAIVSRVVNMVARDRNHPSVIFWSLGNETGVGPNFAAAAAAARAIDPTRLISFLGWTQLDRPRPNAYADIYAPMYDSATQMLAYAGDRRFHQPMIQTEYAHMQGNSGGGLGEYWDAIYTRPDRLQGGFIWDWVEQAVYRYTADGRRYWGDGGSFGLNPGGEIEFGDGVLQADRTPNPQYFELAKVYAPVGFEAVDPAHGRYTIVNRRDFRDLSDLRFDWMITEDGREVARGAVPVPATPARSRTPITLSLPALTKPGAEYILMLRACARSDAIALVPAGHVVGWEQFVLASPAGPRQPLSGGHVDIGRRGNSIVMAAGDYALAVDRNTGLVRLTRAGNLLLSGGSPHFYRAPTDNDLGTGTDAQQAPWRSMSDGRQVEAVAITPASDGAAGVTVRFSLGAGAARMTVSYVMDGSGAVDTNATFDPLRASLPPPTRIGLAFAMPPRFTTMRWYGRGPHESYADRKRSAAISIWEGAIADQYHDYIRPQDTGNKTDVRWMELSGGGAGLRIAAHRPLAMTVLAFPYKTLFRRPPGTWRSIDVVPHETVTLLIDGAQAGIGGDTTWNAAGRPLPQYRTTSGNLTFGFTMR